MTNYLWQWLSFWKCPSCHQRAFDKTWCCLCGFVLILAPTREDRDESSAKTRGYRTRRLNLPSRFNSRIRCRLRTVCAAQVTHMRALIAKMLARGRTFNLSQRSRTATD